jgi:hypothetical protein
VEGCEHVARFDRVEPQDFLQVVDRDRVHLIEVSRGLLGREVAQALLAFGVEVDVLGAQRRLLAIPPPPVRGRAAGSTRRRLIGTVLCRRVDVQRTYHRKGWLGRLAAEGRLLGESELTQQRAKRGTLVLL